VLAGAVGQFRPRSVVARLTPGGRIDRRFGGGDGVVRKQIGVLPRTRLIASAVRAVAVDARDRIVLAGVTYDDQIENREDLGRSYFAVARLEG
jgi:hypothetical protein